MNLDLILKDIKKFENDFESSILTTSEIAGIVIKTKNLRKKIDRAMRAMRNEDQHFHLDAIKTTREFKKTHKEFKNNIKNISYNNLHKKSQENKWEKKTEVQSSRCPTEVRQCYSIIRGI